MTTAGPDPTLEGKIAEVLGEHLWHHTRDTHCACGFRTPLAQLATDGHLAHLAAVLAPLVVEVRERAGRALAMLNAAESCGEDCAVEIAGFRIEPCDTYGKTATTIRAEQAEKDCEELARIVRAGGRP